MIRKDILLPGLVLVCGGIGFCLRRWQLATGYDDQTQLFLHGHPAFPALLLLTAVLALAVLAATRRVAGGTDYRSAFRCPAAGYMAGLAASGLLLLGAGVFGVLKGMEQLSAWKMEPESHLLTYPIALFLCSLLCFLAGPAQLVLGKSAYRNSLVENCSLLAVFPPMAALAWLFSFHLDHGTDPILMGYGISLAAAIFLLLAQYEVAAFFHGRPHPRRALFVMFMGVYLGLVSLADLPAPFCLLLTGALLLSSLSQGWALLRNALGPPWPDVPPAERMPLGADSEDTTHPSENRFTDHM